MTNTELKEALKSQKPVIYKSLRYGNARYKCVYAIRYTLNKKGEFIIQAELLDYNNNSITIVKASEVFYEEVE